MELVPYHVLKESMGKLFYNQRKGKTLIMLQNITRFEYIKTCIPGITKKNKIIIAYWEMIFKTYTQEANCSNI